jgi:cytidylate kinase
MLAAVNARLARRKVPAMKMLKTLADAPGLEIDGNYYAVYKWVEAERLDLKELDDERLKAIAAYQAKAHHALEKTDASINDSEAEVKFNAAELEKKVGQLKTKRLREDKPSRKDRTSRKEMEAYEIILAHLKKLAAFLKETGNLEQRPSIIHSDLLPENVLFKGTQIVAVDGWDKSRRDLCIFDVANRMLVDITGEKAQGFDLERIKKYLIAYQRASFGIGLSVKGLRAFPQMLRLRAILAGLAIIEKALGGRPVDLASLLNVARFLEEIDKLEKNNSAEWDKVVNSVWQNGLRPKNPLIMIGGPAKSGKTTTAKAVARRLGGYVFDFGIIHRIIILKRLDTRPEDEIINFVEGNISLKEGNLTRNITQDIEMVSGEKVSEFTAKISDKLRALVRQKSFEVIARLSSEKPVVLTGRERGNIFGTIAGFYLETSQEARAARLAKDNNTSDEKALKDIQYRDQTEKTADGRLVFEAKPEFEYVVYTDNKSEKDVALEVAQECEALIKANKQPRPAYKREDLVNRFKEDRQYGDCGTIATILFKSGKLLGGLAIKDDILAKIKDVCDFQLGPMRHYTDKEIFTIWGPTGIVVVTRLLLQEEKTAFYKNDDFVNIGIACAENQDAKGYYAWLDKARKIDKAASQQSKRLKTLELFLESLHQENQRIYIRLRKSRREIIKAFGLSETEARKLVKGQNPYAIDAQEFVKFIIVGVTDPAQAHKLSIRGRVNEELEKKEKGEFYGIY